MTYTYKRLEVSEVPLLRALNEVFAEAFSGQEAHLAATPSDEYLTNLLSKSHFIAWVAMDTSQVVGGLVAYVLEKYERARSEIYIYDLAVAEGHRRRGVARTLIDELRRFAPSLGTSAIFVQADREDVPAIRLYESMGVREEPFHFDIDLHHVPKP